MQENLVFYKTCIISKAIEALLQSFWAFLATFMYLLTSNHQISETERYSVYHVFRNIKLDMNMKKFGILAVTAALFFAPMGLSSCSMGSSASEMKGSLNFTQDDLTEKPFKAIDVDVIADVIILRTTAMNAA